MNSIFSSASDLTDYVTTALDTFEGDYDVDGIVTELWQTIDHSDSDPLTYAKVEAFEDFWTVVAKHEA